MTTEPTSIDRAISVCFSVIEAEDPNPQLFATALNALPRLLEYRDRERMSSDMALLNEVMRRWQTPTDLLQALKKLGWGAESD